MVRCGFSFSTASKCLSYVSSSSPWIAYTDIPWLTKYAAISSWVDKGLEAHIETVAPPEVKVSTKLAVSAVM